MDSNPRPPTIEELDKFEKELFDMVKTIKFKATSDEFQSKLKEDVNKIKTSNKVFINADKSRTIRNDYTRLQ